METYFRGELLSRYLYIFLPSETRFDSKSIEFHYYGYEDIPCIINPLKAFVRSPQGARFIKLATAQKLTPFYENDQFFQSILSIDKNLDWKDSDKTARCLYVPVHAAHSFTGIFYLRGDKGNSKLGHDPRNAQTICQTLHQKHCELWMKSKYKAIKFTERERTILQWMAQGKSNSVIGGILGISKHTVDLYLRSIFQKLSVSNRTSAAVKASELGLLEPYIPPHCPPIIA